MAAPKVLVLGSLNGALTVAFSKAATLHSKNNFSFAIVTGNVFAEEDDDTAAALISGNIKVPLPTYFTVATRSLPAAIVAKVEADEEICENLHFLGKRSVTKITEGVRIAVLGGFLDRELGGPSKEQYLPFHSVQDASALKGAGKADILLTTPWPTGVWAGSRVRLEPENQKMLVSAPEIADLCDALKPRYHFSTSPGDFFYERDPFFHPFKDDSDIKTFTRFISMAPYGNASKAKALYAFTLSLGDTQAEAPQGTTPSPFIHRALKRKSHEEEGYSRFSHDHYGEKRRRGHHGKRRDRHPHPPPGPDQCFFCLSNPNLSLHMVCTVGNDSYLATAKGPLATATTFADNGVGFPGHLIITPLAHTPTIAVPGAESYTADDAQRTHAEMLRFKESLQAMISEKSGRKLGAITWEISRGRNIHCHWQFHPIPADIVYKELVVAGFKVEAQNLGYPPLEEREISFEDQKTMGDYFRLWVWADNGEDRIKGKSLVMSLPEGPDAPRFDLQYPRRVIAKLLGLDGRFIWQDCEQTEEEETKDVSAFRDAFTDWDFTVSNA